MRVYTIRNLLTVPDHPDIAAPASGPVSSRADNIQRLRDHRWRCVLKWIEVDIASGAIEVANMAAHLLRLHPDRCAQVERVLNVVLDEYIAGELPAAPPAPPRPNAGPEGPAKPRNGLWHLRAVGLPARGRPRAGQERRQERGQGVTVAVIGTGIDGRHPELEGRVVQALAFDELGRRTQADPSGPNDPHGDGTYVASLIAGHTVGVAPAARLIGLQALNAHGSGTDTPILSALDWLAGASRDGGPPARIAVLCFGTPGTGTEPRPVHQMVMLSLLERGILPIVPIGNEGPDRTTSPGNCYGVTSVGAVTRRQRVAEFSGDGELGFAGIWYTVPSLVAPGDGVYGALADTRSLHPLSGTMPAAAVVAGIAALILGQRPELDVWQLQDELRSRCRILPQEAGRRQGDGLVQARGGTMR
ncbi:S8 family peptidase [Methylobacterium platani]|uniref:Peptidase S8/S53 domain-containing protein n=2 Tax=Methylobacterium platani TaxID=427683 RepID=A0A179SK64_9HYPH|nr:S8 family serine peptidase [Methylobacterium platani]KMO12227.1 hypothetical protein SQ03_25075 [Methylobacterium platani JCM 14648]OAS26944.1 hypothetical protein A5481_02960 [Methylobacterium platani]